MTMQPGNISTGTQNTVQENLERVAVQSVPVDPSIKLDVQIGFLVLSTLVLNAGILLIGYIMHRRKVNEMRQKLLLDEAADERYRSTQLSDSHLKELMHYPSSAIDINTSNIGEALPVGAKKKAKIKTNKLLNSDTSLLISAAHEIIEKQDLSQDDKDSESCPEQQNEFSSREVFNEGDREAKKKKRVTILTSDPTIKCEKSSSAVGIALAKCQQTSLIDKHSAEVDRHSQNDLGKTSVSISKASNTKAHRKSVRNGVKDTPSRNPPDNIRSHGYANQDMDVLIHAEPKVSRSEPKIKQKSTKSKSMFERTMPDRALLETYENNNMAFQKKTILKQPKPDDDTEQESLIKGNVSTNQSFENIKPLMTDAVLETGRSPNNDKHSRFERSSISKANNILDSYRKGPSRDERKFLKNVILNKSQSLDGVTQNRLEHNNSRNFLETFRKSNDKRTSSPQYGAKLFKYTAPGPMLKNHRPYTDEDQKQPSKVDHLPEIDRNPQENNSMLFHKNEIIQTQLGSDKPESYNTKLHALSGKDVKTAEKDFPVVIITVGEKSVKEGNGVLEYTSSSIGEESSYDEDLEFSQDSFSKEKDEELLQTSDNKINKKMGEAANKFLLPTEKETPRKQLYTKVKKPAVGPIPIRNTQEEKTSSTKIIKFAIDPQDEEARELKQKKRKRRPTAFPSVKEKRKPNGKM